MTIEEFKASVRGDAPPAVSALLRALWYDAKGDWEHAHALAQEVNDRSGAWVHAYLHRKEGDPDDAPHWYGQARQPVALDSLEEEWERLVKALSAS